MVGRYEVAVGRQFYEIGYAKSASVSRCVVDQHILSRYEGYEDISSTTSLTTGSSFLLGYGKIVLFLVEL